jgi:SEC-C motif/Nuclease-related domain
MRNTTDVLLDIKQLVKSKGFIYTICLIVVDDFHLNVEQMHNIDHRARLNKNEVLMLLGFLIQEPISFDFPNSPFDLIKLKKRTYKLMDELHHSTMIPFFNKIRPFVENPDQRNTSREQDFFGDEDMFIEPIFYSGDGLYDFQYLEFLARKYKYDAEWLKNNVSFDFEKAARFALGIKSTLQSKINKIDFLGLRENKPKFLKNLKKDKSIPKSEYDQFLTMLEFYQFHRLFETELHISNGLDPSKITENGWKSFYKGLIDLFTISESDFPAELKAGDYIKLFSAGENEVGRNSQFQSIGDFNILSASPIIPLDSNRFFVSIPYSIFEAVYESPYYWMVEDKLYRDKLAENRGNAGEEITYELLKKVLGESRVYRSVKIESKKGHDDTDVDVLCILGSKAICVQVKSKKLTRLSRKGNSQQLKKDFKGAVQDAYEQGLLCRKRIIEKNAVFRNENGEKLTIIEDIDDAYILIVTTENYPSLTHQSRTLLEKSNTDPHPLVLTVFDLDLILFYLNKPYDLFYYIRQRITLMDHFIADEEMHYLGYHLLHKLWKDPKASMVALESDFGQLIDRNYYPLKLGIETSSKTDKIRNRWKNPSFDDLCKQTDDLRIPKKTDIIFHLLDWSEQSRDNLMNSLQLIKSRTRQDGKAHNVSIMAGPERSTHGVTFISWDSNNIDELVDRLLIHSRARKYKSKADVWIGMGSLIGSDRFVDVIVFNDEKWTFDEDLEKQAKLLFEGANKGTPINFGKKVGRNDFCPCGSGVKYKKCCGRT